MSRSAADVVLLSSTRETLFIGPLSAFPVQARRVMLRDRLAIRDALRQFLSRPGAEEMVRPYLRRWGVDGFAMRAGGRAELVEILALAASNGAIALALADEPVVAFARIGEDFDARASMTLAKGPGKAALPDDFLDRLFIVANMVPDHMEGAVKQEFEALIENGYTALLISLVAMMIPGVNLAILGMSLFTLPGQILEAIDKLVSVLEDVRDAKSARELEGAAIAVAAVLAILLREGILRRFLAAKFVAKGMAAVGTRFRKPAPVKKEMRQPQPKKAAEPTPKKETKEPSSSRKKTEKVLDEMYAKAPAAQKEIDDIAAQIAAQTNGRVAPGPVKGRERAMEKIEKEYDGDAARIKDLVRNTIVVEQAEYDKAVALVKQKAAKVKTIRDGDDPLGYTGTNAVVQTKAGISAEIQVNTPEMIFAKEKPEIAKKILGEERYNQIASRSAEGGKGHVLYEEYRTLPPHDPKRKAIEEQSRKYYDSIRKGGDSGGS